MSPRGRKDDKELRQKWLDKFRINRASIVRTCDDIGLDYNRISDWIRLYPDFAKTKKEIEAQVALMIEDRLVDTALQEKNPSNLAQIFYLKHNTEKYNENPNLLQPINVENLWFNKSQDTKHIHQVDDDTQVLAKPSEE